MIQDACLINVETNNSYTGLAQAVENHRKEQNIRSLTWLNEKLEMHHAFTEGDRELNRLIIKKINEAINYRPSQIVTFSEWLKRHSKISLWSTRTVLPFLSLSVPSALLASLAGYILGGIKAVTDWPVDFLNSLLPNLNRIIQKIFDDEEDHVSDTLPLWKPYTDVFYENLMVFAGLVVFSGSMILLYKFNVNYLIQRPAELFIDVLVGSADTWGRRSPIELRKFDAPIEPSVKFTIYMLKIIFKPSPKDFMPLLEGKTDIERIFKQAYTGKHSNDSDAVRQIREKLTSGLCYLVTGNSMDDYSPTQEGANIDPLHGALLLVKSLEIPLFIIPILLNNLKNEKRIMLPILPEDYLLDHLAKLINRDLTYSSPNFQDKVFSLINRIERDALSNNQGSPGSHAPGQRALTHAPRSPHSFFPERVSNSYNPKEVHCIEMNNI